MHVFEKYNLIVERNRPVIFDLFQVIPQLKVL